MLRLLTAILGATLTCAATARAERIDFSSLSAGDVSDADGQAFAWTGGGRSGTVTVRADWPNVTAVDGGLRAETRGPTSFASPFIGNIVFTFSEPVQITVPANFASLLRDGLSGGRFERVQLSSAEAVTFAALPNTTAIYTGAGTSTILADDLFSETPTVSNWGFVGSSPAAAYQLQYTSTSLGLSETFDVIVVPEPPAGSLAALAFGTFGLVCARTAAWGRRWIKIE
jgi:hypothetical protein